MRTHIHTHTHTKLNNLMSFSIPDLYEEEIAGNAVLESSLARVKDTVDCEQACGLEMVHVRGMLENMFSTYESALATSVSESEGTGKDGQEAGSKTGGVLTPSAAAVEVS